MKRRSNESCVFVCHTSYDCAKQRQHQQKKKPHHFFDFYAQQYDDRGFFFHSIQFSITHLIWCSTIHAIWIQFQTQLTKKTFGKGTSNRVESITHNRTTHSLNRNQKESVKKKWEEQKNKNAHTAKKKHHQNDDKNIICTITIFFLFETFHSEIMIDYPLNELINFSYSIFTNSLVKSRKKNDVLSPNSSIIFLFHS